MNYNTTWRTVYITVIFFYFRCGVYTNRRLRNYVESLDNRVDEFQTHPGALVRSRYRPEQSALVRRTRDRDWTRRVVRMGSCAAGGGPPVSFGTTCALLRAWAPPRVSGSDEHDAQPQKICTTRQILHPLPELHGGWLESSGHPWTRRTDEFYGGNFVRANSIGKSVSKLTHSTALVGCR